MSDGTESARYDYGGATLQNVSISGRSTALLLAVFLLGVFRAGYIPSGFIYTQF